MFKNKGRVYEIIVVIHYLDRYSVMPIIIMIIELELFCIHTNYASLKFGGKCLTLLSCFFFYVFGLFFCFWYLLFWYFCKILVLFRLETRNLESRA